MKELLEKIKKYKTTAERLQKAVELKAIPEFKGRKNKIAIVGCSDSKLEAPFKQPEGWEFWGVNNLFLTLPEKPWTRWFEIHNITNDGANFIRREKYDFRGMPVNAYIKQLGKLKCPVYMQKKWAQVPTSIEYPKDLVEVIFGRYFTNTISYEIALGILELPSVLGIYGVDMAVGSEYAHQRPSCEMLIGVAEGLGIQVIVPDVADLLKVRFMYGFEEQKENAFTKKLDHIVQSMKVRQQNAEMQAMNFEKQTQQYVGGIAALREMHKVWETCK